MYAIRTEVMVGAGKVRAWEAWWAQLGDLAKAQHGFQAGMRHLSKVVYS